MAVTLNFYPDIKPLIDASRTNKRFEVAAALNDIADQLGAAVKTQGHVITCGPGCAHCCRGSSILVTTVEVKVIEKHLNITAASNPRKTPNPKGQPCPFLSTTNECTIYAFRPSGCRAMVSIDDPQKCATEELREAFSVDHAFAGLRDRLVKLGAAAEVKKQLGTTVDIRDAFPLTNGPTRDR